jgi:hypothetical protein
MRKTRSNAASIQQNAPAKELETEVSNLPPKPKGTTLTKAKRSRATLESDTEAQPTTNMATITQELPRSQDQNVPLLKLQRKRQQRKR